jgi:V/A-type H+-transporting ATPase subunit E
MKSEIEIKAVLSRAESAAALQERKYILNAKQQIINDTISKARSTLINLPVLEYFDVIYRMIRKYAQNKQGNILFSANDKKRLPVDFNAKLQEALSGKKQASLMVADQEAVIDGGFILVYGEVEENCSFDALFSSAKEDLQDKVNAFLFD